MYKPNNFRICFTDDSIGTDIEKYISRSHYKDIAAILDKLDKNGVKERWWFFEPYIELTWVDDHRLANKLFDEMKYFISGLGYKIISEATPENGTFVGWYNMSDKEYEFEAKTHTLSANMALLFIKYQDVIEQGKGFDLQTQRRFHLLCNQLGYNYKEEARLLKDRARICTLFRWFGMKTALFIWRKIFRKSY